MSYEHMSDAELWQLYCAGNRNALATFFARWERFCRMVCQSTVFFGDPKFQGLDLHQDLFGTFWEYLIKHKYNYATELERTCMEAIVNTIVKRRYLSYISVGDPGHMDTTATPGQGQQSATSIEANTKNPTHGPVVWVQWSEPVPDHHETDEKSEHPDRGANDTPKPRRPRTYPGAKWLQESRTLHRDDAEEEEALSQRKKSVSDCMNKLREDQYEVLIARYWLVFPDELLNAKDQPIKDKPSSWRNVARYMDRSEQWCKDRERFAKRNLKACLSETWEQFNEKEQTV